MAAEVGGAVSGGRGGSLAGRVLRRPVALVAGVVLATIVVVAVLAPAIAPYDVDAQAGASFEAPGSAHLLGTDDAGADMLSLMIWGARISLIVGVAGAAVSMLIGGAVGITAGYFGGRVDAVLMRITDYALVIPDLPLMMVAAAVWGRSLTNVILIIGLFGWAGPARILRAQAKSARERGYVRRAHAIGAGNIRILFRHVLPQVAPLVLAIGVMSVVSAIFAEAGIAFLGLEDPDVVSWGRLIQNAFDGGAISLGAWWAYIPPGIAVGVVALACTLLGREAEDAINPRLRTGHFSLRTYRVRGLAREASEER